MEGCSLTSQQIVEKLLQIQLNMERFLSIVKEPNRDIEINEKKLKYFTSQVKFAVISACHIKNFYHCHQKKNPLCLKSTM